MEKLLRSQKYIPKLSQYCRGIAVYSIRKQQVKLKDDFIKPYDEIPKVKGLPILGSVLDYVFLPKGQTILDLHTSRIQTYGTIFREKLPKFGEILYTRNPDDFQKVFRDEEHGVFRDRGDVWSLRAYAKKNNLPNFLFDMNETEYFRRKEAIQKAIMSPKQVGKLTEMYSEVTRDFMDHLERVKEKGTDDVHDMIKPLFRWAMECAGVTVFQERLGALDDIEIKDKAVKKIIVGMENFFQSFFDMENSLPHHKTMKTKLWQKYEDEVNMSMEGAEELVSRYEEKVFDKKANLSDIEKVSTLVDIFRASIDTTSHTAMWSLVHISKHPEIQEKLYQEITNKIGDVETFDNKAIQQVPYLRACLKEILRLRPLLSLSSRKTQSQMILSGYEVPAETLVILMTGFVDQEKYFEESHLMKPERWMRIESKECPVHKKPHPFSTLPFSHGTRACMGRRLAENVLYCLYAALFKKYKVHSYKDEVKSSYKFLTVVDEPMTFRLEKR